MHAIQPTLSEFTYWTANMINSIAVPTGVPLFSSFGATHLIKTLAKWMDKDAHGTPGLSPYS